MFRYFGPPNSRLLNCGFACSVLKGSTMDVLGAPTLPVTGNITTAVKQGRAVRTGFDSVSLATAHGAGCRSSATKLVQIGASLTCLVTGFRTNMVPRQQCTWMYWWTPHGDLRFVLTVVLNGVG